MRNDVTQPGRKKAAVDRRAVRRHLHELIAALDRRVPRLGEAGEVEIAREAAVLKEKALARLAKLDAPSGPGG